MTERVLDDEALAHVYGGRGWGGYGYARPSVDVNVPVQVEVSNAINVASIAQVGNYNSANINQANLQGLWEGQYTSH